MKVFYCPKCKEQKDGFMYANPYNSTKFCCDCYTALNEKIESDDELKRKSSYAFIGEALANAIDKMFDEN